MVILNVSVRGSVRCPLILFVVVTGRHIQTSALFKLNPAGQKLVSLWPDEDSVVRMRSTSGNVNSYPSCANILFTWGAISSLSMNNLLNCSYGKNLLFIREHSLGYPLAHSGTISCSSGNCTPDPGTISCLYIREQSLVHPGTISSPFPNNS